MRTKKILLTAKSFLIACVIAGGLALTATEATAGKDCLPGCSCPAGPGPAGGSNTTGAGKPNSSGRHGGVMGAIENYSDTMRVRNKAFAGKIIKQAENALGMTCFDRAMAQTSKIGKFFSDNIPSSAPMENSEIFGESAYPDMKAGEPLIKRIVDTLEGPTVKHTANFASSISSKFLGAGNPRYMSQIQRSLQEPLNTFKQSIKVYTDAAKVFVRRWRELNSILQRINRLYPLGIMDLVGQVNDGIRTLSRIQNNLSSVRPFYAFIDRLTGDSMLPSLRSLSSLASLAGTASALGSMNADTVLDRIRDRATIQRVLRAAGLPECARMGTLWGRASALGLDARALGALVPGLKPLIGSGSESNIPYLSFSQLVTGRSTGIDSLRKQLSRELENPLNSRILERAYKDFADSGVLSAPGSSESWPSLPQIRQGREIVKDIIRFMN
jgi:hypothetical protein